MFFRKTLQKESGRYLAAMAFLLITWHLAVTLFPIPKYLVPTPVAVGKVFISEYPNLLMGAKYTATNMIIGGTIGICLGIIVAAVLCFSVKLRWLFEPLLTAFQSFPRESLLPLLVVWLGLGTAPKIVNAALLSFFPAALVTLHALLGTRQDYLALVRNWGMSDWQTLAMCRLPAAVPAILSVIRLSYPYALIGSVLGEFFGGNTGLGYIIISSGSTFRVDRIFAAVILLALIGSTMVIVVNVIQQTICKRFYLE